MNHKQNWPIHNTLRSPIGNSKINFSHKIEKTLMHLISLSLLSSIIFALTSTTVERQTIDKNRNTFLDLLQYYHF